YKMPTKRIARCLQQLGFDTDRYCTWVREQDPTTGLPKGQSMQTVGDGALRLLLDCIQRHKHHLTVLTRKSETCIHRRVGMSCSQLQCPRVCNEDWIIQE